MVYRDDKRRERKVNWKKNGYKKKKRLKKRKKNGKDLCEDIGIFRHMKKMKKTINKMIKRKKNQVKIETRNRDTGEYENKLRETKTERYKNTTKRKKII